MRAKQLRFKVTLCLAAAAAAGSSAARADQSGPAAIADPAILAAPATDEPRPLPPEGVRLDSHSGAFDGTAGEEFVAYAEQFDAPGAAWMQVYFSGHSLTGGSYVRLTSMRDGNVQVLDRRAMKYWSNRSAYFNGDAVLMELVVAPGARGVFVDVAGYVPGMRIDGRGIGTGHSAMPETLCGSDNRSPSTATRDCRITTSSGSTLTPICTGWLAVNGSVLTAGHCVDQDPDGGNPTCGPLLPDGVVDAAFLAGVVEFNVPSSTCNGTPVLAAPADQYPIQSVFGFNFVGECLSDGKDWAVFSINPNGSDVAHVSRGFFRLTDDMPGNNDTLRVTGFGIDNTPTGCGPGNNNSSSQTNQTSTGPYKGDSTPNGGHLITYEVDTMGANSGSPVIRLDDGRAIGIHTTGGCTANGGQNSGTGFRLDGLEQALQIFPPGSNETYVDNGYPVVVNEDGTIFRPWSTLNEGLDNVASGGTLLVVEGSYSTTPTITKKMTVRAPVGTVTIGK